MDSYRNYWNENNESISMTSAGSPWLQNIDYCEWKKHLDLLKSRLSLHSCSTENEDVPIVDTEFQYIDSSLAQWKHRNDFIWFAVTSVL